jgi:glutamate/tyrosine decarboxylase-like PLP-dependent enzyme
MNEPRVDQDAGAEFADVLRRSQELALRYIESLDERDIGVAADHETLRAAFGKPLGDEPLPPQQVIQELYETADPGIVATNAGRFFGFVEGGVLPAALGADWLASTWDQNPGFYVLSPAAAAAEEVVSQWLLDLLILPTEASVGFTTGAQLANVGGLAAGRHHVLKAVGWDVEADGLQGAPPVTVVVGEERHATIGRALRFLGLGERNVTVIPADAQGRLDPSALGATLKGVDGPLIVCAQAGNVNTGAFDPFKEIAELCHERGGWMHVDGAFGLWAAASPRLMHLTSGVELADSWAVDAHKWLNVPYDSGIVICAHPESHRTALALHAPYLIRHGDALRDGSDWTPESSRRARVFAIWAALRSLGRKGVASMIEACCEHAKNFAEQLATHPDIDILNDVVLNQVLVRVGDDDERTKETARRVQAQGRSWLADTVRHGKAAIRISVSDHATTPEDVTEAVKAIVSAAEQR